MTNRDLQKFSIKNAIIENRQQIDKQQQIERETINNSIETQIAKTRTIRQIEK